MKYLSICLLAIFSVNHVDAQLNLDPLNKEVTTNSSIEKVFLKKGRDKIFLTSDSITFHRDYYNYTTKATYSFKKQLKNEGFNVPLNQLQDLAKGKQVIDKAPIYIETYFADDTKGKQMIYSNVMIEDLFGDLYEKYKVDINAYVGQLPSGKYGYPMFINRRIKENQSDFYKTIEKELIAKGMINEDIYNQPKIYINKVQSTFDELNKLDNSTIESYQILDGETFTEAIYGSSAKNGIVLITLK